MTIVKFPAAHQYNGYGYDTDHDFVISYKRNANGQNIGNQWSNVVKVNGRTVTKSALKYEARFIQNDVALQKSKQVTLQATPAEYIMFSTEFQCSMYFVNVGISAAFAVMKARGFNGMTLNDMKIMNPHTGAIKTPKAHTVVTYTFE
jgi:hypothetical protein